MLLYAEIIRGRNAESKRSLHTETLISSLDPVVFSNQSAASSISKFFRLSSLEMRSSSSGSAVLILEDKEEDGKQLGRVTSRRGGIDSLVAVAMALLLSGVPADSPEL